MVSELDVEIINNVLEGTIILKLEDMIIEVSKPNENLVY